MRSSQGVSHVICEENTRAPVRSSSSAATPIPLASVSTWTAARPARSTREQRPVPRFALGHRGGAQSGASGDRCRRSVERTRHRMARARLRADAMVGEGYLTSIPCRQYAAVGAAGHASLTASVATLRGCRSPRGLDVGPLLDRQRGRIDLIDRYVEAYRRYVWPVSGIADLRLAPSSRRLRHRGICGSRSRMAFGALRPARRRRPRLASADRAPRYRRVERR